MIEEIWKPTPRFDGYEVSNLGRVRSWVYSTKIPETPHLLTPQKVAKGYYYIHIGTGSQYKGIFVHRLVLEAFVGPRPLDHEAAHLDGVRTNNYVGNLQWKTRKGNAADRFVHGTDPVGSDNPMAKFSDEQVLEIRKLSLRMMQKDIAKMFNVSRPCISSIVIRKTYANI